MGDVAMTVPVIKNLLDQHPGLQVTVVSNAQFAPMFDGIGRCNFHPASLKITHKGAMGIYRLFRELVKANRFTAVADLHGVLRSTLLTRFFSMAGYSTATIDKGRKEKKALTRKDDKILMPLTATHERYANVFRKLNWELTLDTALPVYNKQTMPLPAATLVKTGRRLIGIAPFAQHPEKMYPLEKMKEVVATISRHSTVFLFGGGTKETSLLQQWANDMPEVHSMAGKYSFREELHIISNLDVMISMDSANMHLASLFNIPVISIWGATHPFAGFNGWNQSADRVVSVDLSCRPCSVFGNKPCWRGDHACMQNITPGMIIEKL